MIPIAKPLVGLEELNLVREVLESGIIAQGPKVAELERLFAELTGTAYAVATNNGTSALHLALLANGIGAGDEVITSPFTFIASANSILFTGAVPRFVDICPDTFTLNPAQIEEAITPRTKAIMPVHLYGLMADMNPIMEIAERYGLAVIEDAAQAHGASYKGRAAGSFGTGCFSLYATKNMTTGEGGIVTTDDPAIAERLNLLRAHGAKVRYYHDELGYNYRLTDLHAAVGIAQIHKLHSFNQCRAQNAQYLNQHITRVVTPQQPDGYVHVWHQYTVRVTDLDRGEVVKQLAAAGVGTGIFYPVPVYRQKVYQDRGYTDHLPVTEEITRQVISLPVHPALSQADLDTIVDAVNAL